MRKTVGGGPKKVLYTLQTVKRIGLKKSAKALRAKNTCKTCGLGMGGQQGGMTNELGEFPSVCNKSIQAQSSDIQAPIPSEIFKHSVNDLRELSAHELEHLGRLNTPIFKTEESNRFYEADWAWAIDYIASRLEEVKADRSFFYSSGRSSNESGFILQLLARLYGTNNVNNCSYYCHQATSVGLDSTIGTGTATIELEDLSRCDLIFVIGANPSSNHPRFIHKLKECRERGGHVIVINPAKEPGLVKFAVPKSFSSMITGGSHIASYYLQPNIGSDIALLKGLSKAIIEQKQYDQQFIETYCDGFETFKEDALDTSWKTIEEHCGIDTQLIKKVADIYGSAKNVVFAWGMGITHHQFGCNNVEYIANLALLRGMIGLPGRGLLPLRGHSNVQGVGTIGVKPVLADDIFKRIEKELDVRLPKAPGVDTYNGLKAAFQGKIDCALIVGGNLYSASPNTQWTTTALNQIGFKCFLTTTLNQGHIHGIDRGEVLILPVKARDEENQSTTQESMFNYVRLSDGGIERLDNTRSEIDILASIGQRLLPEHQELFDTFTQHDTIRKSIAKIIPGMESISDIGVAKREFHIRNRIMHQPHFNTPNNKATFITHKTLELTRRKNFPFLLASVRSEGQFNSIIYEETDSYRHNADRHSVFMSKKDMKSLCLNNGEQVDIISEYGIMPSVSVREFDIPPGNLLAYYPEANVLTGNTLDPRSKTPNFKSVPVSIRKNHNRQ